MTIRALAILALTVFAASAAAQTVTVRDDTGTPPAVAETAAAETAVAAPAQPQTARTCMTFTGSRVTANRNARAVREGRPERECANGTGRVYSDEDIERTGQRNIADALRTLDTGMR